MNYRKIIRNKSSVKLKDLLQKDYQPTFSYKGYYYCALKCHSSLYTKLSTSYNYIPCLNLRSLTIRGIDPNEYVETIRVDIDITESEQCNKKIVESSCNPFHEQTFTVLVTM